MKILSIFGTWPAAVRMAPLVSELQCESSIDSVICVTAQHRSSLDQVMTFFRLHADYDLDISRPGQTLNRLMSRLIHCVDDVLEAEKPDRVLVHGDTTTASACALAAFHRRIPIGHIEAGLRTEGFREPFPEEMNQRVIDQLGTWLFASTEASRQNLIREHAQGRIWVTGNTAIDALAATTRRLSEDIELVQDIAARHTWMDPTRRLLLVMGHRRDNLGDGSLNICRALAQLAQRNDLQIVYPGHMNAPMRGPAMSSLASVDIVRLIEPLTYVDLVWLMARAHLILTDSSDVQEEAPFLGKPILVTANITQRPEAVAAGTVLQVGTDPSRIVAEVTRLMDDGGAHAAFTRRTNPYGDGQACARIVCALKGQPVPEFSGAALV